MEILVTGLTSLHWGRMEFGNAGNYYICPPFFDEIYRVFPGAAITTTLQLSSQFASSRDLSILPIESYYSWRDKDQDRDNAYKEYAIASIYKETGLLIEETDYISACLSADLIVFWHGDMWGDNADANGKDRFLVDLLKLRTAQSLCQCVVMMASSPGPVTEHRTQQLAKYAFRSLTASINRESKSKDILERNGFEISHVSSYACPAFLFSSDYYPHIVDTASLYRKAGIPQSSERKNIGIIPATYSVKGGSFEQWCWEDHDFLEFVELIEYIIETTEDNVIINPHAYGFQLKPTFRRTHWRDYEMCCSIYDLLKRRNNVPLSRVFVLDQVLYPWESHAFLGGLDLLISGRVHGSVGALTQCVPTMAISYKNGPLAHKMSAFFEIVDMQKYVIPSHVRDFRPYFDLIYAELGEARSLLEKSIPSARAQASAAFDELKRVWVDGVVQRQSAQAPCKK